MYIEVACVKTCSHDQFINIYQLDVLDGHRAPNSWRLILKLEPLAWEKFLDKLDSMLVHSNLICMQKKTAPDNNPKSYVETHYALSCQTQIA